LNKPEVILDLSKIECAEIHGQMLSSHSASAMDVTATIETCVGSVVLDEGALDWRLKLLSNKLEFMRNRCSKKREEAEYPQVCLLRSVRI
jgi:hypothetical protein